MFSATRRALSRSPPSPPPPLPSPPPSSPALDPRAGARVAPRAEPPPGELARARGVPRRLLALGRRALERLALDVRGGRLGRGEDALHLRGGLGRERGRPAGGGALSLALNGVREIPQVGIHGRRLIPPAAD